MKLSTTLTFLLQALAVTLVAAAPTADAIAEPALEERAAANTPNLPFLRIEALTSTVYELPIYASGHNVTTASGGNHHCDGTNNNANPSPSDTPTSALDAASKIARFSFDGTYDSQFDDFFVTQIGPSTQTATQFWGLLLNYQFTPVGGCQQEVKTGDQILWAFDAFNKSYFLKLQASTLLARPNQKVTLTVTDGTTGVTISGADFTGGQGAAVPITNSAGQSSVSFSKPGIYALKAERSDSIRSNAVVVVVT